MADQSLKAFCKRVCHKCIAIKINAKIPLTRWKKNIQFLNNE